MIRRVVLAMVCVACVPAAAWAHPGGLDSRGGHHDRRNGGYHTHRYASSSDDDEGDDDDREARLAASPGVLAAVAAADQARISARTSARTDARTTARTTAVVADRRTELASPLTEPVATPEPTPSPAAPAKPAIDPWQARWDRDSRTWTSVAGSTLRARLVSASGRGDDRVVSLERRDRVVQRVPVVQLIHEDRIVIDDWARRRS